MVGGAYLEKLGLMTFFHRSWEWTELHSLAMINLPYKDLCSFFFFFDLAFALLLFRLGFSFEGKMKASK